MLSKFNKFFNSINSSSDKAPVKSGSSDQSSKSRFRQYHGNPLIPKIMVQIYAKIVERFV